ncbi:MAG: tRNA (adenosine(37)-N6)-threonylcarbamoyltransferase complex dimerization subunit type 1 TsaB [Paludibacteraceae bacterium]|nr:tRNA (adenosine(37)-N6)-threonylcarbamoyltransferase complex dimerization subunit type 1 TsaB [Paludibacteraceae bacterium]
MTILCIETSTSVCSAAICKDGAPIKQCICLEGSNHARLLPRYIEELLSFAREQQLSIDAVALSEGPGSYTGLRIGTSTAKGLCYGMDIPLIPVPTLAVLCEAAKAQSQITNYKSQITNYKPAILVPMIDARRMEVYTTDGGEKARAVVVENEESVLPPSLVERDGERLPVYYFGDGAAKCQSVLTSPNWHFIPGIVPEAKYMGGLVESQKSKLESQMISGQKLAYYEPYYLKEFVAAQSHVKGLNS